MITGSKGGDITLNQARAMLHPYGELSRVEYLQPQLQARLNLPKTVVVEFARLDTSLNLCAVRSSVLSSCPVLAGFFTVCPY